MSISHEPKHRSVKNRERILVDDPGLTVTLTGGQWSAVLRACEKRAAEAGQINPESTLAQAIAYLTEKTTGHPVAEPLPLRGRLSGFCLMCDACVWTREPIGQALIEAVSAIEFPKKVKPEPTPEETAELKRQIAVAEAILAEYGDGPVPLVDEPKPEGLPKAKPTKAGKPKPSTGQASLFSDPTGSRSSVA